MAAASAVVAAAEASRFRGAADRPRKTFMTCFSESLKRNLRIAAVDNGDMEDKYRSVPNRKSDRIAAVAEMRREPVKKLLLANDRAVADSGGQTSKGGGNTGDAPGTARGFKT